MNEALQTVRTLDTVAAEIRALTASMLNDVIEIGRRMTEAKEMVPYGTFGTWIKENTDYSVSTANNFMALYREYGDRQSSLFGTTVESQTFGKLSYSKALALLAVPAEERESFAVEVNAEEISTRELKQAILERDLAKKARDEAVNGYNEAKKETCDVLASAERAEKKLKEQMAELQSDLLIEKDANKQAKESIDGLKADREKLMQKLANAEKRVMELKERPVEVAVQEKDASPEQIAAAKAEAKAEAEKENAEIILAKDEQLRQKGVLLDSAEKELERRAKTEKELEKKLKEAEEKIKTSASAGSAEAEKLTSEIEALKKQLAMSGEIVTTFKLHFADWQRAYNAMLNDLEKMDEDTRGRMRAAMKAQKEAWT